jgi:hypothetical protein
VPPLESEDVPEGKGIIMLVIPMHAIDLLDSVIAEDTEVFDRVPGDDIKEKGGKPVLEPLADGHLESLFGTIDDPLGKDILKGVLEDPLSVSPLKLEIAGKPERKLQY